MHISHTQIYSIVKITEKSAKRNLQLYIYMYIHTHTHTHEIKDFLLCSQSVNIWENAQQNHCGPFEMMTFGKWGEVGI
jgi:hypothetical protein